MQRNIKSLLRFTLPLLLLVTTASAATLFDRKLVPAPNTLSYSPGGLYILGDDLGFGGFTQPGTINAVTVWMVGHAGTTDPKQEAVVSLYLGFDPGPLTKFSPYTFLPAGTYANPVLGPQPIFALKFSGLNFDFPALTTIDFAVEGITTGNPFNLTSVIPPGPCVGSPFFPGVPGNTPCDQVFLGYNGTPGTGPYNLLFTSDALDPPLVGDINVLIEGTTIPEPGTYAMVGLGLLGAVFALRRRR